MQVFRFSCFHICLIGILYNLYFGLSIPFLYFFENVHFYTVKETLDIDWETSNTLNLSNTAFIYID